MIASHLKQLVHTADVAREELKLLQQLRDDMPHHHAKVRLAFRHQIDLPFHVITHQWQA
jgi:hypothetical protein